jgi:hypothetical protein
MNDDGDETHIPLPWAVATVDQSLPNFFESSSSSPLPPPPTPVIQEEFEKEKPVKGKQVADDTPPPERLDSDPPKEKSRPEPNKKPGVRPEPNKKPGVRPEPGDSGQSSFFSTPTSQPRSNAKDPAYKDTENVGGREDHLFCPIRLADSIMNHHSRIFLNRQVPGYRNPLLHHVAINYSFRRCNDDCTEEMNQLSFGQRGRGTGQCRQGWGGRKSEGDRDVKEGRGVF